MPGTNLVYFWQTIDPSTFNKQLMLSVLECNQQDLFEIIIQFSDLVVYVQLKAILKKN